jgi:hypothetical protein
VLAFMPPADFPADIDGNLYYKRGSSGPALFYTPLAPPATGFELFACTMTDCLEQWRSTPFFLQSKALRYPGFEASSLLLKDPQFANWIGEESAADDFRLAPGSPVRGAGVVLPSDIRSLDKAAPAFGAPDIGCYQAQPGGALALKLRVGVGDAGSIQRTALASKGPRKRIPIHCAPQLLCGFGNGAVHRLLGMRQWRESLHWCSMP